MGQGRVEGLLTDMLLSVQVREGCGTWNEVSKGQDAS